MQKQIHHALHRLYSRFHLYHEHVRFRDHHVHRPPRLRAHHAFDHLVVHVLHDLILFVIVFIFIDET